MQQKFLGFIAGVLTTAIIGSLTVTALAASGQVSFNLSAIQFNGQTISSKGENYSLASGVSVPSSITYTDEKGGGTTYLPARRISELMDVEIGYDNATGSVTVGKSVPNTVPSDDYSDWTVEEEAAYQEFKAMWEVGVPTKTNCLEMLYKLKYSGGLDKAEFQAQWNQWGMNQKELWVKRFAYELRNNDTKFTTGLTFYYNSISLGYSNSYPRGNSGYELASLTPDPFMLR